MAIDLSELKTGSLNKKQDENRVTSFLVTKTLLEKSVTIWHLYDVASFFDCDNWLCVRMPLRLPDC